MDTKDCHWLALVISLPTAGATGRMRIWRALKALGCGALRDGVYLLPAAAAHAEALQSLADETIGEGGTAWLLPVSVGRRMTKRANPETIIAMTIDSMVNSRS